MALQLMKYASYAVLDEINGISFQKFEYPLYILYRAL